jgi:excisionase family DNA binding protein
MAQAYLDVRDAREDDRFSTRLGSCCRIRPRAFLYVDSGKRRRSSDMTAQVPQDTFTSMTTFPLSNRLYYRPAEIVKLTGLAKSTVFAALYSGELEGHRVGKAWLVPVAALDRWIRGTDDSAA